MRSAYALFGAESKVHAVRFTAEHNYNKDSREAMYAWMARWLQNAPADVKRPGAFVHARPAHRPARVLRPAAARRRGHRGPADRSVDRRRRRRSSQRRSPRRCRPRCVTRSVSAPSVRRPVPRRDEPVAARSPSSRRHEPDVEAALQQRGLRRAAGHLHAVRRGGGREGPALRDLQPHRCQPARRRHRRRAAAVPVARARRRRRRRACRRCWPPPSCRSAGRSWTSAGFDTSSDAAVSRTRLHSRPAPRRRLADGGGDGAGEIVAHDARDRFRVTGIRVEREPLAPRAIVGAGGEKLKRILGKEGERAQPAKRRARACRGVRGAKPLG